MKCAVCSKSIWDGAVLLRQNPKGEQGIFNCEEHSTVPPSDDVASIIDAIKNE